MLTRLRSLDETSRWWCGLGVVAAVVSIPLLVSGPGNDLDVGNVFRSGRAIARHLGYVPSRPPGAPVHEAIVGVLDLLGGPLLTNLASFAAAAALLWSLDRLLRDEGVGPARRWAVLLLGANPWFIVAATSTADYVFALLFVVLAARALRADRAVLAGALGAAAMGCRVGSAMLLIALVVAELGGRPTTADQPEHEADQPRSGRLAGARLRRLGVAGATGVVLTGLLFVPSAVHAGGLSFAQNDFSTSSPLVQLGRALAKDVLLLGLPTLVLALVALPATIAAIGSWRSSWPVRFALTGLVLSQVLFIRFPWKMAHLLPCLLCLAILWAVALEERPRLLVAMVALQLVFAVVRVDVIQPDDPNEATGGKVSPGVSWGPVITDWRCRRDHPDAYLGRQKEEIEVAWDCAAPYRS